ncbi:hypothetical protein DYB37_007992 [Aphanomyces astaci]|uniref:Uncharacterized protein n=1 Tax=Aphanomyces astaci TaxID=112090 RepID=A0A3R7EY03_APHAT|nr:hypothetical protein DYB35_008203 [Aphanomyces astaci]RHZ18387.1 hypothetical protein DYB37_007992 [Aphanomyces astaci]
MPNLPVDSSTFRVHLLNWPSLSYVVTISTEAFMMVRPALRQVTVCTPVVLVNTTLNEIRFGFNKDRDNPYALTRPLQPVEVIALVALEYPFELAAFRRFHIHGVSTSAHIQAILPSSL